MALAVDSAFLVVSLTMLSCAGIAFAWRCVDRARNARTHERKAREETERLQREIERARSECAAARSTQRAQLEGLFAAAHDLRQPLRALDLLAGSLRGHAGQSPRTDLPRLADDISASVDELGRMCDEWLDFARLDGGGVVARPCATKLAPLFARLQQSFEQTAFDAGLVVRWCSADRTVLADPALLERVLRNLVANALRHTEDGGVLVLARARGGDVLLQVWDSGTGISRDDLAHLFDPFFQGARGASSGRGARQGAGLGLAIVARLARAMSSRIEVRSVPGRGSVFSLRLPAASGVDRTTAAPPSWAPPTLTGRRILLAGLPAEEATSVSALLRTWGADVVSDTKTGDADLLVVDAEACAAMPDASTGSRDVPVILVGRVELQDRASGSGVQGLQRMRHGLARPVRPHRLRALVTHLLARRPD